MKAVISILMFSLLASVSFAQDGANCSSRSNTGLNACTKSVEECKGQAAKPAAPGPTQGATR